MEFRLTIGIGQDKDGAKIDYYHAQSALAIIGRDLSRAFGGCTETRGVGGWINDAGDYINEPCTVFTVAVDKRWFYDPYSTDPDDLSFIITNAKQLLNQERILVSIVESQNHFV